MTKDNVIKALRTLEEKYHKKEGYNTIQILKQLKIESNRNNAKLLRRCLRSMISNNVQKVKEVGVIDYLNIVKYKKILKGLINE